MIADGAGRQFDAVADDVVLDRLERKNLLLIRSLEREEFIDRQFGIENGLCEKSIFLSSSFHSYIGKSTIQHSSKRSFCDEPKVFADLGARRAGEFDEALRLAGDEEHGVAVL